MRPIGFSTGALALGDFDGALAKLSRFQTKAVELSALREHELPVLMQALQRLELSQFQYVSVHVPSKFGALSEAAIVAALEPCLELDMPLVVHPDAIKEPARWDSFGSLLCIENMDRRKRTGRTIDELSTFFDRFPSATFCLDLAHARQIDPTMTEARLMLQTFGDRLRQVHISEIDSEGHHEQLGVASVLASQSVANLIPHRIPIIIESMIRDIDIPRELDAAQRALTPAPSRSIEAQDWGELA